MPYHAKTVDQCLDIATAETEYYQRIIDNELHRYMSVEELTRVTAKRDAAQRIASLIRFGHATNGRRKAGEK